LIEEALSQYLQKSNVEPKMNEKKYKMSFDLVSGKEESERQNKI